MAPRVKAIKKNDNQPLRRSTRGKRTPDIVVRSAPSDKESIQEDPAHLEAGEKQRLVLVLHLPRETLEKIFAPSSALTTTRSSDEERWIEEAKSQKSNPRKREANSVDISADHGLRAFTPSTESAPKRRRVAPRRSVFKAAQKKAIPAPVRPDFRLPCCAQPEVWAEERPELCETLKYFNAFQGASATKNGHVRGMLLDKDSGGRSYMDEAVVITRAGGGIGTNETGEQSQMVDQDSSSGRIKAFFNNKDDGVPIILVVGDQNAQCPSVIPHKYCVMGSSGISHIWAAKSNRKVQFYFRMEKLDLTTKSWWAPVGTSDPPEVPDFNTKALRQWCSRCQKESTQVYEQGWMCLNQECGLFWSLNGIEAPDNLTYNPLFLNERTIWTGLDPPYAIKAALIDPNLSRDKTFSVSEACTKGVVCPLCGRCVSRRHWDSWRCPTNGCGFIHKLQGEPLSATIVSEDLNNRFEGPAIPEDVMSHTMIKRTIRQHGLYRVHTYSFQSGCTASHIFSNDTINAAPGGSDEVFLGLQTEDLGLQRFPLSSSVVTGTLAKHYSRNYGLPYKFVVDVDSKGFSEAPLQILEGVRRMTWAGKYVVGDETFKPFNELLAVGYFEGCKMGFHDDGEDTLEDTVASWSLGCESVMRWRLKKKYYSGFTNKDRTIYDPKLPIVEGCYKPELRRELNTKASTLDRAALTELAKKTLSGCRGDPPVVLTMKLRHGDFMVMHGAEMQKYFEHEVIPSAKLRFGLTCRTIKADMLPSDQLWKCELPKEFQDGANPYDGDLALYENYKSEQKARQIQARSTTIPQSQEAVETSTSENVSNENTSDSQVTGDTPATEA